jgi:Mce-associated membrane protein
MTAPDAPPTRGAVLLVALAGLAVVLAATLVTLVLTGRPAPTEADQTALAVARQAVGDLLTVDRNDPKGSVQRLADRSTGEFRRQLDEMADGFVKSLRDTGASASGQATEAGIRGISAEQASVLVTATATVRNSRVPAGESVPYRLVVGLQRTPAGWLVSSMEFVP